MVTPTVTRSHSRSTASLAAPIAAFVAAAGFVTEAVISLIHHTGDDRWDGPSQILNAAYALAAVALVVALPAVGGWLQINRIGRAGVVAAQIGYAAMAVESIASGFNDGNTLGGLFFAGLLLSLVGLLVVGVTGLIGGGQRWAALLPFLGMLVGTTGGEHGGSIVLAGVWMLLGLAVARSDS